MNRERHECIQCEYWKTIQAGTPEKVAIGNLIPEIANETLTVQKVIDYCKLGHTKEEDCKDFKRTNSFVC